MTTELENVPTEVLLRATFAAQREAFDRHPDRGKLDLVRDLIRQEVLDVFGVYERERQEWNKDEEPGRDRSFKAISERATVIANRVVRKLAIDDSTHAPASAAQRALNNVLVLRVDDAYAAKHLMFPNQRSKRMLMVEVTSHPGWPQGWLVRRLTASGALVGRRSEHYAASEFSGSPSGWGTAPDLELVVLKRDGSGFLVFRGGERRHFGAAEPDEQLTHGPYGPEAYAPLGGGQKMEFDFWLELGEKRGELYRRNRANSNEGAHQGRHSRGVDR